MAERELSVLAARCLTRRRPDNATGQQEIAAWARQRNDAQATVPWRFTPEKAPTKLHRLYPSQPVWCGSTVERGNLNLTKNSCPSQFFIAELFRLPLPAPRQ